jgi:hypothetical protein
LYCDVLTPRWIALADVTLDGTTVTLVQNWDFFATSAVLVAGVPSAAAAWRAAGCVVA